MTIDKYNLVSRLAEHQICYGAKRAAEMYFQVYDKSDLKNQGHLAFHPDALVKCCRINCLTEEQAITLREILVNNGFSEGL